MITSMILLATARVAAPVPPTPPVPQEKIIRKTVIDDGEGKRVVRPWQGSGTKSHVIVIRDSAVGASNAPAPERREFRIVRKPGGAARHVTMIGCEGGTRVDTEAQVEKDGQTTRTRVLLCAKGDKGTNQVEALERAAERIAENKEIPDEVRNRVIASLNEEIGRLKADR